MLHRFTVRQHQSAEKRKLIAGQPGNETGKRGVQSTDTFREAEFTADETPDHFLRFAPVNFHNGWSIRLFRSHVYLFVDRNLNTPGLVY